MGVYHWASSPFCGHLACEAPGGSSLGQLASHLFLCGVHWATQRSVLCAEPNVISLGCPDFRTQRYTSFPGIRPCLWYTPVWHPDVASGGPQRMQCSVLTQRLPWAPRRIFNCSQFAVWKPLGSFSTKPLNWMADE